MTSSLSASTPLLLSGQGPTLPNYASVSQKSVGTGIPQVPSSAAYSSAAVNRALQDALQTYYPYTLDEFEVVIPPAAPIPDTHYEANEYAYPVPDEYAPPVVNHMNSLAATERRLKQPDNTAAFSSKLVDGNIINASDAFDYQPLASEHVDIAM